MTTSVHLQFMANSSKRSALPVGDIQSEVLAWGPDLMWQGELPQKILQVLGNTNLPVEKLYNMQVYALLQN